MSTAGADDESARDLGVALMKQGQFAEAAEALRRAVEESPTDDGGWRLLGGALASQGDTAQAIAAFEQAVTLAPGSAKNHYNLGVALQNAGRLSEARGHLEQALALDSSYVQARTALAALTGQAAGGGAETPSPAPAAAPTHGHMAGADDLTAVGGSTASAPGEGTAVPPPAPQAGTLPPGSYVPPPVLGQNYGQTENTSGMKGAVPTELQGGWNWGAFAFGWIWLFNHKLPLLAVGVLALNITERALSRSGQEGPSLILSLALLGVAIYLGIVGNRLGWQNRRFDSVEDFKACQRVWMRWAIGFLIVFLLIILAAVLTPVFVAQRATGGG